MGACINNNNAKSQIWKLCSLHFAMTEAAARPNNGCYNAATHSPALCLCDLISAIKPAYKKRISNIFQTS